MDGTDLFKLAIFVLLAAPFAGAQSAAYAKFGAKGETIGLFHLQRDTKDCESERVVVGTLTDVRADVREREVRYRLTIKVKFSINTFVFVIDKDVIPFKDVENLLAARRAIKVRACRSGKRDWAVEEIAVAR